MKQGKGLIELNDDDLSQVVGGQGEEVPSTTVTNGKCICGNPLPVSPAADGFYHCPICNLPYKKGLNAGSYQSVGWFADGPVIVQLPGCF